MIDDVADARDRRSVRHGDIETERTRQRQIPASRAGRGAGFFTRPLVLANETIVFVFVSVLDFFATYLLLAWPGSPAFEANPFARWWLNRFDVPGLIAFKLTAVTVTVVCCEVVAQRRRGLGRAILIVATIFIGAVAGYGTLLLARVVGT